MDRFGADFMATILWRLHFGCKLFWHHCFGAYCFGPASSSSKTKNCLLNAYYKNDHVNAEITIFYHNNYYYNYLFERLLY